MNIVHCQFTSNPGMKMLTGDYEGVDAFWYRSYFFFKLLKERSPEPLSFLRGFNALFPVKVIGLVVTYAICRKNAVVAFPGALNEVKSSELEFFSVLIQKFLDGSSTRLFSTDMNDGFQVKIPQGLNERLLGS